MPAMPMPWPMVPAMPMRLWRYLVISAFRDLGLSELGLFGGDLGLFCGDLGLFCGDLGPVLW